MVLWLVAILALPFVLAACQQVRLSPSGDLSSKPSGALRFATWNVHYIWLEQEEGRWGLSGWEARKEPMDAAFKALEADVIGFQEMESFARGGDGNVNLKRDWLLENNPAYAATAMGDARRFPSTQPIFYRPEVLRPLDQGWFFFSRTPDVLYSRGFDGATPSFTSWARFERIADGTVFRAVNIHPDAFSRTNRVASAELAASRIKPWIDAGETLILLGDFNARRGSVIHQFFEDVGITFPDVPGATFHLSRGLHLFGAIDHIGLSDPNLAAGEPQVFNRKTGEVWASDHHPVTLDVRLP
ncbi:MAG: endonuclease/exonuclease/phosphatase family protein [Pseudomonadota bacterium]